MFIVFLLTLPSFTASMNSHGCKLAFLVNPHEGDVKLAYVRFLEVNFEA